MSTTWTALSNQVGCTAIPSGENPVEPPSNAEFLQAPPAASSGGGGKG